MLTFCRQRYIQTHSTDTHLQTYWDIISAIKTTYSSKPHRAVKSVWLKKMRQKISEEVVDRDTQLYEYILKETNCFKEWKKLVLKKNTYMECVHLFNQGVLNHGWESFEGIISHFNRVWLGHAKPKDLTLYNKRANAYMTTMKSNNYMIHLIIYLHIQSQPEMT